MSSEYVCECCLSNDDSNLIQLSRVYKSSAGPLVYRKMLLECFNITIPSYSHGGMICVPCSERLRDSYQFYGQVRDVQKTLKLQGGGETDLKSDCAKLKVEASQSADEESESERPKRKCTAKLKRSRLNQTKNKDEPYALKSTRKVIKIDFRTSAKGLSRLKYKKTVKTDECDSDEANDVKTASKVYPRTEITLKKLKMLPTLEREKMMNQVLGMSRRRRRSDRPVVLSVRSSEAILNNIAILLAYSNATPFRGYFTRGFRCYYCNERFLEPELLRAHSRRHDDDRRAGVVTVNANATFDTPNFFLCIDIKDLQCTICNDNIKTLEDLKSHLTEAHDILLLEESGDRLVQFWLDDSHFCVMCEKKFTSFRALVCHMNAHYPNSKCDKCGEGFITNKRLMRHMELHRRETYECSECKKNFQSKLKMRSHEASVHFLSRRFRCLYCDEKFFVYKDRQRHMETVHGAQQLLYECKLCGRNFKNNPILNYHMRKYHWSERRFECDICNRGFFSKTELTEHIEVHQEPGEYLCDVCDKKFTRLKTLRQHKRIHADAKCVCYVCGKKFATDGGLNRHVSVWHPDVFIKSDSED